MKRFLFAFALILTVLAFAACQTEQDVVSTSSRDEQSIAAGGGGSTPSPVIVYGKTVQAGAGYRDEMWVMDVDGTDKTRLMYDNDIQDPIGLFNWAPTTKKLVWQKGNGGVIAWRGSVDLNYTPIRTGTVNVSGGKVTLKDVATIATYTINGSDTMTYHMPRWTSVASPNEIAVVRRLTGFRFVDGALTDHETTLGTIPASGGTFTALYTVGSDEGIADLTWSPDGSAIAILVSLSNGNESIRLISRSDGSVLDTLLGSFSVGDIEWSRTGDNFILYHDESSSPVKLYYADVDNANTSTYVVDGVAGYWSPTNAKILFRKPNIYSTLYVLDVSNSSQDSLTGAGVNHVDWHR